MKYYKARLNECLCGLWLGGMRAVIYTDIAQFLVL
jgi:hypothetical protein